MSTEQNTEPTQEQPNNQSSDNQTPEDERKKQFERMREKFGRQNSPMGGKGSGNNFY